MSGLTISQLISVWGFEVDSKALDALDQKLDKLKASVAHVGLAAVGAAAAMFGLAEKTGETGAELKRTADRIGISTDALQEYQFAARMAGQTNEGFQGSLQTMVRNLFDARRGIGASREAFYLLGNAMGKDLMQKGRSAEEILNDVADGLQRVADPSRKLELAQQLFGGDGAAMLTTLAKGSAGLADMRGEARSLGAVMSREALEASEHFHQSLERTKTVVMGLRNAIGVQLFPVVERVMAQFTGWIAVNRKWLTMRLHDSFEILTRFISNTLSVVGRAASVANTAAIAFGGWNRVLRMVTLGMVALLAIRTASFVGELARMAVGFAAVAIDAALAAAPILAVGAAIIALLLIIEDVVAYFQGRKSITGLLLKDFGGFADGLFAKFDQLSEKASKFARDMAVKLTAALLDPKNQQQFIDAIEKWLDAAIIVSGLGIKLGISIGKAIIQGIEDAIRESSPELAAMLRLGPSKDGPQHSMMSPGPATSFLDSVMQNPVMTAITDKLSPMIDWLTSPHGIAASAYGGPAWPASAAGGGASTTNVTVSAPITINPPPGSNPEDIGEAVAKHVADQTDKVTRQTNRATAPAVSY